MTITNFFASAVLLIATATPAFAAPDPRGEPAAAPTPALATPAVDDQRRYCFRTEMTGTMIARRVCLTRAAWRDEGVDVDKYVKR